MHSYEEYDEPIQKLINFLSDDYPSEFVLEIDAFGAQIKNRYTIQAHIGKDYMVNLSTKLDGLEEDFSLMEKIMNKGDED